jgi:hypothetical protein
MYDDKIQSNLSFYLNLSACLHHSARDYFDLFAFSPLRFGSTINDELVVTTMLAMAMEIDFVTNYGIKLLDADAIIGLSNHWIRESI